MSEITLLAVFLGGLISFLSPCVLPLVPPYLTFMAGTTLDRITAGDDAKAAQRRVFLAAIAFVLGFTTVFVLLGAAASSLGLLLRQHMQVLSMLAGGAILVMGLHFLGVFRIGVMYRELRFSGPAAGTVGEAPPGKRQGLSPLAAYGVGLAFAFGWTPCIGPVLAAVLAVAAREETVFQGMGLLALYSAGLGVPFLLAAGLVKPFLAFSTRFKRHMQRVEQAMGVLLVLTGIAFLTGWMQSAAFWLLEAFPALGRLG